MAITATCDCGRVYKAEDRWAGKKMTCRDCKGVMVMPGPDPEPDPVGLLASPATRVTDVRLVAVRIPFMDMAAMLFQVAFAGLLVSTVLGGVLGTFYWLLLAGTKG